MNNTKNNGGPAFPHPYEQNANGDVISYGAVGMTLRDYFAAKIFPEVYRQYADQANANNKWDPEWEMYLAVDTYRIADAMLKAREQ